jgi:hypothetical protein
MDGESFLEVAFLMTTEFNQCFTVGTLKGRRYNTLAGMSKAALQHHGLPQHQIDYLQPQRASQRSVAAAHQVAWTIPKRS